MKCPVCPDATLLMSERQSVEIDYCPTCRGVWLDRGELDKLIQLSATREAAPAAQPMERRPGPSYDNHTDHAYKHGHKHGYYHKKSWLSELFD